MMPLHVAVFVSGRGSNLRNLWQASQQRYHSYNISAVIADQPCPALDFAHDQGITTGILARQDRIIAHSESNIILENQILKSMDIIALAGFMRLIQPDFLQHWHKPIVNIHPSLLPRHRGLDTHARALAAGDSQAGCSVHHIDSGIDTGQIIAQTTCPIKPDDTIDLLAKRVLQCEHLLYPVCLDYLARGQKLPRSIFTLDQLQTLINAA